MTPQEFREMVRKGNWQKPTSGVCAGYAQANLVIVPKILADDFRLFCKYNPKSCPVVEIIEEGNYLTKKVANNADVRSDFPQYNIFKNGILADKVNDISSYWQDDFVTFLLGCSFSFEEAMIKQSIPVRNIEEEKNVSMYHTNIACKSAGVCEGNMVVSMRPIHESLIQKTIDVTEKFPLAHGAPIHVGSPEEIGIKDLFKPDFGDKVSIRSGEVPVFWACGVTPSQVIINAKPAVAITHTPGHMLVTDKLNDEQ